MAVSLTQCLTLPDIAIYGASMSIATGIGGLGISNDALVVGIDTDQDLSLTTVGSLIITYKYYIEVNSSNARYLVLNYLVKLPSIKSGSSIAIYVNNTSLITLNKQFQSAITFNNVIVDLSNMTYEGSISLTFVI